MAFFLDTSDPGGAVQLLYDLIFNLYSPINYHKGKNENKPKQENETHAFWGQVTLCEMKMLFKQPKIHFGSSCAAEQTHCWPITSGNCHDK